MVLQAYIDDSYDGGGVYVLAGYIASAESWASFTKDWEAMLSAGILNNAGKYRFKMSEMALSEEIIGRVSGFHNIINKHVLMSISCVIDKKDIDKACSRISYGYNYSIKVKPDPTPFSMCYSFLMNTFHIERINNPSIFSIDEPVDFYFDESSEKSLIIGAWDEHMSNLSEDLKRLYGSSPHFENDEVFLPLQAADFRAWWVRKWAMEHGIFNVLKGKYPFPTGAKVIDNAVFPVSEEDIVSMIKETIQYQDGFDVPIMDSGPSDPINETFIVQKICAYLKAMFK